MGRTVVERVRGLRWSKLRAHELVWEIDLPAKTSKFCPELTPIWDEGECQGKATAQGCESYRYWLRWAISQSYNRKLS